MASTSTTAPLPNVLNSNPFPAIAPILHTPRLTLTHQAFDRPSPADLSYMVSYFRSRSSNDTDSLSNSRLTSTTPPLGADADSFLNLCLAKAPYPFAPRAILYSIHFGNSNPEHPIIGHVSISRSFEQRQPRAGSLPAVDLGWSVIENFRGNGIATEAAQALMDYGRRELGVTAFIVTTTKGNLPSRKVAEKLGMKLDWEGALELLGKEEEAALFCELDVKVDWEPTLGMQQSTHRARG